MIMFVIRIHSICEEHEKEAYTRAKMQVLTLQHGLQSRIAYGCVLPARTTSRNSFRRGTPFLSWLDPRPMV